MKKIPLLVILTVCFALIGTVTQVSPVEAGTRWIENVSSTSLPYILADDERDLIYLGDAQNKELLIIDSNQEQVIDRVQIPGNKFSDMALSKDNNILAISGGSLVLVDTQNLAIKVLNIGMDVVSVAFDYKDNLYFSTTESWGKIYYFDLAQEVIVHSFTPNKMVYRNALVKTDADGKTLYVAERGLSPASLYKFDVSGDEPVFVTEDQHGALGSNLRDFVISPDGKTIYMACGSPYGIQVVDAGTIQRTALLSTGAYPGGVALDKFGIYVYGIPTSPYNNILYQFKTADVAKTRSFDLLSAVYNGQPNIRGIALSKNGDKAFIVHGTSSAGFQVQVVDTEVNINDDVIAVLEKEIEQLQARIKELEDLVATLLTKNQQYLDETIALKAENADLQNQLNTKSQQVTQLEQENSNLKSQIEAKNRYIEALMNYIRRLWDYIRQIQ